MACPAKKKKEIICKAGYNIQLKNRIFTVLIIELCFILFFML
jgi:hypothetical protein